MRIGIIGAGISGLSAAWYLRQRGHDVTIFEKAPDVGGLVATFDFDGVRIDHFYHFLCRQDTGYFELCRDLGLGERIRFVKARTGFFYDGREYPFGSPTDLLRFSPLPFTQRLRVGAFALEARLRSEWTQLDDIPAKPWLIDRTGRQAYDIIWHPLLAMKFGDAHSAISAAWMWHRLHRVAKSKGRHGYLEGGTALLLDSLVRTLKSRGVSIHVNQGIQSIEIENEAVRGLTLENGERFQADAVISTLPLPALARILPQNAKDYGKTLQQIDYIGITCAVFKLKRPVSKYFWYNVHDPRLGLNGIIEYTNLNPLDREHGHIVYVPYYGVTDSPPYTLSDDDVFQQSWNALQLLQPRLDDDDLLGWRVFRSPYGQALCPTGFLDMLPDHHAPIRGLHLLDSTFLYPEDRSQSGLILKARAVANHLGAAS